MKCSVLFHIYENRDDKVIFVNFRLYVFSVKNNNNIQKEIKKRIEIRQEKIADEYFKLSKNVSEPSLRPLYIVAPVSHSFF